MAMIITPEPSPVSGPSSATPRVKMLGNMMELKNPTSRMDHIATGPLLKTETVTSSIATMAQKVRTLPVLTFCKTAEPMKRPIMAPPQ